MDAPLRRDSLQAMEAHWPAFLAGAQEQGVAETDARAIFEQILGFAAYGFPTSHAVAFALLAYESAWLRHYYLSRAAFYCALFNSQPLGFYSSEVLAGDARRHEVTILPPDINVSLASCSLEDEAVRLGLTMVQGPGRPLAEAIVA